MSYKKHYVKWIFPNPFSNQNRQDAKQFGCSALGYYKRKSKNWFPWERLWVKNTAYKGTIGACQKSMGEITMKICWKATVNELLEIFHGAMFSIIPQIGKAKINWKEGKSYDDWDNIANALYENIVCSTLYGEVTSEYSIAKYDLHYEKYSNIDFIKVYSKEYPEKNLVFISFQCQSALFNIINAAIIDSSN